MTERLRKGESRAKLAQREILELLQSGRVLTNTHFRGIYMQHGLSPSTAVEVAAMIKTEAIFRISGINLNVGIDTYRTHRLFFSTDIPLKETDMDQVKAIIDQDRKGKKHSFGTPSESQ